MIGQFKLTRMTVIWPTSRKREQEKRRVLSHLWLSHRKSTSHEVRASIYCTLSIQISKTKLLVNMASESGRFANLTEQNLQEVIDNKDSKQTKAVIEKSVGMFRSYCESKDYVFSEAESIMILNCPVSCERFTLKYAPNQVIIMPRNPSRQLDMDCILDDRWVL